MATDTTIEELAHFAREVIEVADRRGLSDTDAFSGLAIVAAWLLETAPVGRRASILSQWSETVQEAIALHAAMPKSEGSIQ